MYVTITSITRPDEAGTERLRAFVVDFLPRLRQAPGVLAIYDCRSEDIESGFVVMLWDSEADAMAYRSSDLFREVQALESELGITFRRQGQNVIWSADNRVPAAEVM